MTKLSKRQLKERDALATKLSLAWSDLENVDDKEFAELNANIDAYNVVVREANEWRADIASDIESYIDDKSEKWREGERGEAFGSWLEAWQEELEEIAYEDDFDISNHEHCVEALEQLPTEPD